jgi:hypothetical protein
MQYLVIAYDATDDKALDRRFAARERHLETVTRLKAEGRALYGAAILDEQGTMRGSMLVVDFDNREELDRYLASDPYVTGKVWEKIEVRPCRVPELFLIT